MTASGRPRAAYCGVVGLAALSAIACNGRLLDAEPVANSDASSGSTGGPSSGAAPVAPLLPEAGDAADLDSGPGLIDSGVSQDAPATEVGGPCPAAEAPFPACGSLCGNGIRDTCAGYSGVEGGASPVSEVCDGTDLAGASCTSLGYKGGTLKCGAWCDFDTTTCDPCEAGGKILSCGDVNVDAVAPTSLALATTDTEIVLAWVSGADAYGYGAGAHMARFRSDLSLIAQTGCLGATNARSVALAIAPSGWILAIESATGIELHPLDPTLAPRGATRFLPNATWPVLVSRQLSGVPIAGGPLFVWTSNVVDPALAASVHANGRWAALLGDDATSETSDVEVAAATIDNTGSGIFTGEGFLYADREFTTSPYWDGIAIEPIGLDGKLGPRQTPVPQDTEAPDLGWTGTEARLVYNQFGNAMGQEMWLRLDAKGAPIGSSVPIGGIDQYDGAVVATVADDTLVLLADYSQSVRPKNLDILRISTTGTTVDGPYALVLDPFLAPERRIARRGPEAVVAWLAGRPYDAFAGPTGYPGGVGLARVAP
jgi:hypothetical protein